MEEVWCVKEMFMQGGHIFNFPLKIFHRCISENITEWLNDKPS